MEKIPKGLGQQAVSLEKGNSSVSLNWVRETALAFTISTDGIWDLLSPLSLAF